MTEKVGKPTDKKNDEWQRDLNPDPMAGQNHGLVGEDTGVALTAYDVKGLHQHLQDFNENELHQITLVPQGGRLAQGATYVDLMDAQREPFTAMGGMEAAPGHWYVSKTEVDYLIWNRLTKALDPEQSRQNTIS